MQQREHPIIMLMNYKRIKSVSFLITAQFKHVGGEARVEGPPTTFLSPGVDDYQLMACVSFIPLPLS